MYVSFCYYSGSVHARVGQSLAVKSIQMKDKEQRCLRQARRDNPLRLSLVGRSFLLNGCCLLTSAEIATTEQVIEQATHHGSRDAADIHAA